MFDIRKEAVVYKVTTRSKGYLHKDQKFEAVHAAELIKRALDSLISKDRFNAALAKETSPLPPSAHTKTTYKACKASPLSLPDDLSKLLEATVVIHPTEVGTGSGFFISEDGLILTAAHVVEDQKSVRVETKAGFTLNATVLRRNNDKDTALLKVDGHNLACLNTAPSLPAVGTDLYAVGAPMGDELKFSVSKGIVSGIRNINDCDYIQTDTELNPGNSGGPLVNSAGQVVGLVSWKHRQGEALAFAVPIHTAVEALGLQAGNETEIAVKAAEPPKPVGPVIDIPDPIPPDPQETFNAVANELRPSYRRMQGGSVLIVFSGLSLFSGIITAAVTQTTTGIVVGASLATLGLAGFIGGVTLVASGKREERMILRGGRKPLISAGPLPDLRGGTVAFGLRF